MFKDILLLKPNWCDAILLEGKDWEVRGHATKKREIIGLAKTGTGHVQGECEIVDCIKLTRELFDDNVMRHQIPLTWEELLQVYSTPYAWVISSDSVKVYDEPIPFDYPKGAVIWVKYDK